MPYPKSLCNSCIRFFSRVFSFPFLSVFSTVLHSVFPTVFLVFLVFQGFGNSISIALAESSLFPFMVEGASLPRVWMPPKGNEPAGANGQVRAAGDIFVDASGERLRFWGTNLSFKSNFPDKKDAAALAKRLRAFGFNVVRLHFVDTEIWGKYRSELGCRKMDEEERDRLDWFIFQLKECGIYVNINLHVGRVLDERDGNFPEAKRLPNMQKGVGSFLPEMLEREKEYARDLLTHVNPYLGKNYLEDPCVACIEINNENSILCEWNCGHLDDLPDLYAKELNARWNAWLRKRYVSTEALREAWNSVNLPLGEERIPDSEFSSAETFKSAPWFLEKGRGTDADVSVDEAAGILRIDVRKAAANWDPQFYLTQNHVEADQPFLAEFRIRSTVPKQLVFYFMENHSEWRSELRRFPVMNEWQTVQMKIRPKFSDSNVRFGFAALEGVVEIDRFSVRPGGSFGMAAGETLENGTISFVKFKDGNATLEQKQDFQEFLLDLDREYWQTMYRWLKEELKPNAPIAGTQLRYASTHAQAELDYCDIHEYWCHPRWPNRAWDYSDWFVENQNFMERFASNRTYLGLANHRVAGKPYVLSEFNQPYPNLYSAEGFAVTACLGAFQNWSGIYSYCWAHDRKHRDGNLFFDLCENSVLLVHHPALVDLFVRGNLKSVTELPDPPMAVLDLTKAEEWALLRQNLGGYHRNFWGLGMKSTDAFQAYCTLRLPDLKIPDPLTDSVPALNRLPGWNAEKQKITPENAPKQLVSPTGEVRWNGEETGKAYFLADTPKTKFFTGKIAGRSFTFHDGTRLTPGKTLLDWAAVSLTQTSEKTWLLAATGVMKNSEATYRPYDQPEMEDAKDLRTLEDTKLFSPKRGQMPRLCEGIPLSLVLPVPAHQTVTISALDGNAEKTVSEACSVHKISDSEVEIRISPKTKTLWYLLEIVPLE